MIAEPVVIVAVVAIVILAAILIFYKQAGSEMKRTTIKIGGVELDAEIVDNDLMRAKGLMFRSELAANEGMLFVFNKSGYHSIWMMNMRFSIDIIWLNESKHVVTIKRDAQPCTLSCESFRPSEPARYVLEVNSGFASKHAIKNGSAAEFSLK